MRREPHESLPAPARLRGYSPWAWILQAVSGIVLLVTVTLHMAAQHFGGSEGILTYAEVVAYLRRPAVFVLETLFAAVVIFHALAGIRAILLDLGVSDAQDRRITLGFAALGALLFLYTLVLTVTVVLRQGR